MDAGPLQTAVPLFRMEGVSKRYGGVRALEKAELTVNAGRIHAILGENGAGKSTLIKIMAGVVAPDEGRMAIDGRDVSFASPAEANAAGIACIFQELSLIPDLSVADNIVDFEPAEALRHDRQDGAAPHCRGSAGPRRRGGHPSARAGEGSAAVAPPDRRDRQGAGAQPAHPDPRRGDLGADGRRRRQDLRCAEAAALGRPGAALHLASHARDRRAGGRVHRVSQRPQRCQLRGGHQIRQRRGRDDDRPRIQPCLSTETASPARGTQAGARMPQPLLDRPAARHIAVGRGRRGGRARRARRARPTRVAAGLLWRAARLLRVRPGRRQAGHRSPAPPAPSATMSAWR